MTLFHEVVGIIAMTIEGLGVAIITLGLLFAVYRFVTVGRQLEDPFRNFRKDLGKGILLGLEFLVAGDIIRTVAVTPSIESVAVLGIIVLIRIFLSMALEVELEGRVPWRRAEAQAEPNT